MDKIIDLLKQSPLVILVVAAGYFGKVYVEGEIDNLNVKVNEISKSSLSIKKELRSEERQSFIDFRISIERWEHFLLSSLTNFSTNTITKDSINDYFRAESELQLAVKEKVATLGIVVQNEEIYNQAYPTIINISNTYNPFISKYLPQIIDLQSQLAPIEQRIKAVQASLENNTPVTISLEQAKSDQKLNTKIQTQLTTLMQQASDELLQLYPNLVEQLTDLKILMNNEVYRPLDTDEINQN